jgi:hypothetical protein
MGWELLAAKYLWRRWSGDGEAMVKVTSFESRLTLGVTLGGWAWLLRRIRDCPDKAL